MCRWAVYICRVLDDSALEDNAGLLALPDKGKIMRLSKIKEGSMLHSSSARLLCAEIGNIVKRRWYLKYSWRHGWRLR